MGFVPNVRAPGFHTDVPAHVYHGDPCQRPSLSSSLAKVLVNETPKRAWLSHPKLNPDFTVEHDSAFDLGDAVHDFLASGGQRVRVITGFTDYRKEGARTERDTLRAAGLTPLLEHQAEAMNQIVESVAKTLHARGIALGAQESVFIAEDRGVLVRAMMDSFEPPHIRDFKISGMNLANDAALGRHIADMSYDLSAYFYLRVAGLVFPELAGRLKFSWIMVEKDAPYGVRIVEADATFIEMGRRKYEHALGLWQRCLISNRWNHLENLSPTVPYPAFVENSWLEREQKDGFIMGPLEALRRGDDVSQI